MFLVLFRGAVAPIAPAPMAQHRVDVKVTENTNATYMRKCTPVEANLHTVCIA